MDWLTLSLDPARAHLVDAAIAWHGRLMVLAWGILIPLGVVAARFFKVMPGQDWPQRIDNRAWWMIHLTLQYGSGIIMFIGIGLIGLSHGFKGLSVSHAWFGYALLSLGLAQFLGGWLRGTKGGPGEPVLDGDHYNMTPRRILFEYAHKGLGYLALLLSIITILTGLWLANAPRWMVVALGLWWVGLLVLCFVLQKRGMALDTYQAIWGPSLAHPGNRRKPIGWGVSRRQDPAGEGS